MSQGFYRPIRLLALQIGYKYEKIRSKFGGFYQSAVTRTLGRRSQRAFEKGVSLFDFGMDESALLKVTDIFQGFIVFEIQTGTYIVQRTGSAFQH